MNLNLNNSRNQNFPIILFPTKCRVSNQFIFNSIDSHSLWSKRDETSLIDLIELRNRLKVEEKSSNNSRVR